MCRVLNTHVLLSQTEEDWPRYSTAQHGFQFQVLTSVHTLIFV